MLNDVTPDETDDPEEDDNDPGEVLGTRLTVEILQQQTMFDIFHIWDCDWWFTRLGFVYDNTWFT